MYHRGRTNIGTQKEQRAPIPTRLRIAALMLGGLLTTSLTTTADEVADSGHLYQIAFIDQSIGSELISQGDMSGAQEQIETGFMLHDRYERYTNLCVTLISRHAYGEAMVPCRAAVRYSQVDFGGMQSRARERQALKNRKTLALSNLGVLQALIGQGEMARESFEKATARKCLNSDIASYNLSVMDQRDEMDSAPTVALIGSVY